MKEGQGSRTAERVAERRAAHQILDSPVVFADPLALRIIEPEAAARIRAGTGSADRTLLSPFLRAALAVRSRFAEDELAAATARGVSQYVVLGAGFDTFAYRNPFPALRVLEVDYPATQAVKRTRLGAAGIEIPSNTTFVPVDFESTSLREGLAAAGFDTAAPAFFSWLGVVPYLERSDIEATLRFVASLPRGTTIVFDYGSPPSALNWVGRLVFKRMAKRVAAIGEPWKTFFAPDDLLAMLRSVGFSSAEDSAPAQLNARYFSGRTDGLRVAEMAHIAKAIV